MSKSCGHPCDAGDQILCCVCTRVQRSSDFPGQEERVNDTLNSCALCERYVIRCVVCMLGMFLIPVYTYLSLGVLVTPLTCRL